MKNIPFVIAIPLIVVLTLGASLVAWKLATKPAPTASQMPVYEVSVEEETPQADQEVTETTDSDIAGMQKDLEATTDDGGKTDLDSLDKEAASL